MTLRENLCRVLVAAGRPLTLGDVRQRLEHPDERVEVVLGALQDLERRHLVREVERLGVSHWRFNDSAAPAGPLSEPSPPETGEDSPPASRPQPEAPKRNGVSLRFRLAFAIARSPKPLRAAELAKIIDGEPNNVSATLAFMRKRGDAASSGTHFNLTWSLTPAGQQWLDAQEGGIEIPPESAPDVERIAGGEVQRLEIPMPPDGAAPTITIHPATAPCSACATTQPERRAGADGMVAIDAALQRTNAQLGVLSSCLENLADHVRAYLQSTQSERSP